LLDIVDRALALPGAERIAFLSGETGSDAELNRRALELLSACERAEQSAFLSDPAAEFAATIIRDVDGDDAIVPAAALAAISSAIADRYTLANEIGRGGNAIVFLARDVRHQRDVAVKVIRPELAAGGQRARFLREITIAAQLRHPYVVPLIDSGDVGGWLFYVMPFIEGESLRQRIDRMGPLSLETTVALARDMAEALDTAHGRGIVHRDVKPQNVMLSGGHALVADFGIALALEPDGRRITELGIAVGTPAYMSPEQASGSTKVDGRSDVYALGCVVYEMLTGEVPYHGVTPQAIRAKHLHAPVPDVSVLRPSLPRAVQDVIARALAKTPAERFETAGAMVEALVAAGAGRAPRRVPLRALLFAAAFVLVALTAWRLAPWRFEGVSPAPSSTVDQRRIAVLWFDDLSDGNAGASLASGLTQDLIDELGAVRGLTVISTNGVRQFRETSVSVDSIARMLRVGTVVSGSVTASDTRVRATVRLIDPSTREQRHSRSFDVARHELLALRSAIVQQVATFLRERLGQEIRLRQQQSSTRSVAAWEAMQRGDEIRRDAVAAAHAGRDADAADLLHRADSLYGRAQALDTSWPMPLVGRGWTALGLALLSPVRRGMPDGSNVREPAGPSPRWMTHAVWLAGQAMRQSPSAEALALRGYARWWLATLGGVEGADSLLRQSQSDVRAALDERPDDARSWYVLGALLNQEGRFREAADAFENAYEADAYLLETPDVLSNFFFISLYLERFDDARRWCATARARYPSDPRFATCSFIVLGWTGRTRDDVGTAWRELQALERYDSSGVIAATRTYLRLMIAAVAARAGLADSARTIIREARQTPSAGSDPAASGDVEAYVRLLLGEREHAIRLLLAELSRVPATRGLITRSPWFRELMSDARLAPYLSEPPVPR
jgi:eukaryotic-like serine/threonine-protein kinase